MNSDPFNQWLSSRNIDAQTLTPELRAALVAQWADEEKAKKPPEHVLLVLGSDDCRWPPRVVREACH